MFVVEGFGPIRLVRAHSSTSPSEIALLSFGSSALEFISNGSVQRKRSFSTDATSVIGGETGDSKAFDILISDPSNFGLERWMIWEDDGVPSMVVDKGDGLREIIVLEPVVAGKAADLVIG